MSAKSGKAKSSERCEHEEVCAVRRCEGDEAVRAIAIDDRPGGRQRHEARARASVASESVGGSPAAVGTAREGTAAGKVYV